MGPALIQQAAGGQRPGMIPAPNSSIPGVSAGKCPVKDLPPQLQGEGTCPVSGASKRGMKDKRF